MKILLLGYMGSGKSFIGNRLAARNDQNFIDFDAEIEKRENSTISEIFQKKGEIYFRKVERKVLVKVLSEDNNAVISLGGGTPCYGDNMELIKKNNSSISFYLKLDVQTLTERLESEKAQRPMISHLQEKEKLEEYIRKHLFERGFYYNQSDKVINCTAKSSEDIISEILENLG